MSNGLYIPLSVPTLCQPEVTTRMREKGINNMECIDREVWRRKVKL